MEIIFIVGSIQALFFVILIFNKRNKSPEDYLLGAWLLLFCIHFLFPCFAYKDYPKYAFLAGTDAPLLMAHIVFLFIYTRSLIHGFKKYYLLHQLWVVIAYLLFLPYILLPGEKKQEIGENIGSENAYIWIAIGAIIVFCAIYLKLILHGVKKHRRKIKTMFSFEEHINLRWISILAYSIYGIYLLVFGLIILVYSGGLNPLMSDYIMYVMLVLFIYVIGYWGYRQNRIFVFENNNVAHQNIKQENHTTENKITKADLEFRDKLDHFMLVDKPYLNGKLSLIELATQMNTTSHYISHILNNVIHSNFYDYVNRYRVEEIKNRLAGEDAEKFTLLGLAYESGFNSKASFNRVFKNITGLSPSEYLAKK